MREFASIYFSSNHIIDPVRTLYVRVHDSTV